MRKRTLMLAAVFAFPGFAASAPTAVPLTATLSLDANAALLGSTSIGALLVRQHTLQVVTPQGRVRSLSSLGQIDMATSDGRGGAVAVSGMRLNSVDGTTGRTLWARSLPAAYPLVSSLLITGNTVYVTAKAANGPKGVAAAYDLRNGAVRWIFHSGHPVQFSQAQSVGNMTLAIDVGGPNLTGPDLVAFDSQGRERWRHEGVDTFAVTSSGHVLVRRGGAPSDTSSMTLEELNASSGQVVASRTFTPPAGRTLQGAALGPASTVWTVDDRAVAQRRTSLRAVATDTFGRPLTSPVRVTIAANELGVVWFGGDTVRYVLARSMDGAREVTAPNVFKAELRRNVLLYAFRDAQYNVMACMRTLSSGETRCMATAQTELVTWTLSGNTLFVQGPKQLSILGTS